MPTLRSLAPLVPVLVAAFGLVACGADGAEPADLGLSAAGRAGQDLAIEKGCGSCHGINGEGGVAPALQGLVGRTVTLGDGTTLVADEAYIIESILQPNAKRVDGYSLPMPQVNLSDEELASIVTYIAELPQPATTEAP
jgi:cytochrome c oxidase subunit 2